MTPASQQLIRTSWAAVEPIADDAATLFYSRLFELDPSLEKLFSHTDMQKQRKVLMQTLAVVVANVDRLDQVIPAVQALGRRHAGYGVEVEHYATVGSALLWTLEQGLGDTFTDDVAYAWADAYRRLSSTMIEAAQQVEEPAPRPMHRRWRTAAPLLPALQTGSAAT
jgi:hemoglobin-like flavoprotein